MTNATELLALMQARALAESEGERTALATLIQAALLSMAQPVEADPDRLKPAEIIPMWAQIMRAFAAELESGRFDYPFKFDVEGDLPVLCVRPGHVMEHLRRADHLEAFWDMLPAHHRSDRVLKRDLVSADVALMSGPIPLEVERTVKGQRVGHLMALSLSALAAHGIQMPVNAPVDQIRL